MSWHKLVPSLSDNYVTGTTLRNIALPGDTYQSTSMIRAGVFPSSPLQHTVGFSTRTLDLFHNLFTRCPRLSIQPFIKALCDLQGQPFQSSLTSQLSHAYDAYLEVKRRVHKKVLQSLGRDIPDWRLTHTCPCCQLELKEDHKLPIRMMVAMDGNDSLRRVERKTEAGDDSTVESSGAGSVLEWYDPREGGGDYFLSRREVDNWAEEKWHDILPFIPPDSFKRWVWEHGKCEEKWFNGSDTNTRRMWARFCETGLFLLVCRHGLVLLMCDMVRSGELSKYPLAVLHRFLDASKTQHERNGKTGAPEGRLTFCYDIGCRLEKTISRSPLLGLAQYMGLDAAVGTMHGYAHQRACQLNYLLLYRVGAGLEDGETCERYFSKSNALATAIRHASVFHRHQMISEYAYHMDNFETYGNLSKFLYNNYKQALDTLNTIPSLRSHILAAKITDPSVFYEWLVEEGEYLQNLSQTPPEETLKIDYFNKLVALRECLAIVKETKEVWLTYVPGEKDKTNSLEHAARHARENERKLVQDIQTLEDKLEIQIHWTEGSEEWEETKKLVNSVKYRKALDKLEGLLVSRIFELSHLNVSGTGYKMRKHLAKALKTRSKSIQRAITEYNAIAAGMKPPRPEISWDEVMEYTFLSEFDILHDAREDVQEYKWASSSNRHLMTQFYKVIRAEEELSRLHLEIQRLLTYMKTETDELLEKEQELAATDPTLALQVRRYRLERGRFNAIHRKKLFAIRKLPGFNFQENNKFFSPGTPTECKGTQIEITVNEGEDKSVYDGNEDEDEDDDEQDNPDEINHEVDEVLSVAMDQMTSIVFV
ncbi:hypothetical protein GYMLUDRAFT_150446 [Collybiopsis luxurians FD-317 M1]|nr:hypothetical protein GYMLUDRAFT_150446 [Collybiopsis luxurians FD-317 M1]